MFIMEIKEENVKERRVDGIKLHRDTRIPTGVWVVAEPEGSVSRSLGRVRRGYGAGQGTGVGPGRRGRARAARPTGSIVPSQHQFILKIERKGNVKKRPRAQKAFILKNKIQSSF